MKISAFGEAAILIELDQRIDGEILARARAIADAWERQHLGSAVPAYASVLVRFDPLLIAPSEAARRARSLAETLQQGPAQASGRLVEVPTRYDGPDLAETAVLSGLTVPELIEAHAGRDYTALFLGFMPGFAYCGSLDARIVAPRLDSPRSRVPAGSVAIADGQTAIYPLDSPGGWRLLGHTELRLFAQDADPPALIRAGDRVRFTPR